MSATSAAASAGIGKLKTNKSSRKPIKASCCFISKGQFSFLLLTLREDDLIDWKINHHLHTAVDDGDEDVVQRGREELLAQRHINAHQKAAHDGDEYERHHVPRDLIPHIALRLKRDITLHRKINALRQKQRDGKRRKIAHTAGSVAGDWVVEYIGIHRTKVQMNQLAGDAAPVGQVVEQPRQKVSSRYCSTVTNSEKA